MIDGQPGEAGPGEAGRGKKTRIVWECLSLADLDLKGETEFAYGYTVGTDRDGDKIYHRYESKLIKGKWATTWNTKFAFLRGTGKYEGIKEGGTAIAHTIAPNQGYEDWEMEVEFPR